MLSKNCLMPKEHGSISAVLSTNASKDSRIISDCSGFFISSWNLSLAAVQASDPDFSLAIIEQFQF